MRSAAMATHPEKSLGAELLQRAAFSDERRGECESETTKGAAGRVRWRIEREREYLARCATARVSSAARPSAAAQCCGPRRRTCKAGWRGEASAGANSQRDGKGAALPSNSDTGAEMNTRKKIVAPSMPGKTRKRKRAATEKHQEPTVIGPSITSVAQMR